MPRLLNTEYVERTVLATLVNIPRRGDLLIARGRGASAEAESAPAETLIHGCAACYTGIQSFKYESDELLTQGPKVAFPSGEGGWSAEGLAKRQARLMRSPSRSASRV